MSETPAIQPDRSGWRCTVLRAVEGLAVALAAFAILLNYHNPNLHIDECYHLLAAESLQTDGDLKIGPQSAKPYDRAWAFTHVVSWSTAALGDSLFAGRLPAMLSGALLAAVMWLALRGAGLLAALAGTALVLVSIETVHLSNLVRFYAPHGVVLTAFMFSVYQAVWARRKPAAAWGLAALCCLPLAMHLHELTVVPAGLTLAAAYWVLLGRWSAAGLPGRRGKRAMVASAVSIGAAALAFAAAWRLGIVSDKWGEFRHVAPWAASTQNDVLYYWSRFEVWTSIGPVRGAWILGFPLAVALGCLRNARLTLWMAFLCVGGIGVMSWAGMKAPRYIYFALPMFYGVWGVAIGEIGERLRRFGLAVSQRAWPRPTPAWMPRLVAVKAFVLVLVVGGYVMYRTPMHYQGGRMLLTSTPVSRSVAVDWASHLDRLTPLALQAEVVTGSEGPKLRYYFDRLDYSLSVTQMEDLEAEFEVDFRMGVPVISTPESLAKVVAGSASGLVISEDPNWRMDFSFAPATADWVEANLTEVPLAEGSRLHAFVWGLDVPALDASPLAGASD
ncbi:MAG: hypothetical protein AAF288_13005 [Planctomycetota bacterium]